MNQAESAVDRSQNVHKIGGANMTKLGEVGDLVAHLLSEKEQPVLVVSAFQGVTNALLKAMDTLDGKECSRGDVTQAMNEAQEIVFRVIDTYFKDKDHASEVKESVRQRFEPIVEQLTIHLGERKRLSPRTDTYRIRDQVIALGEETAVDVLERYLQSRDIEAAGIQNVTCSEPNGDGVVSPELSAALAKLKEQTTETLGPLLAPQEMQRILSLLQSMGVAPTNKRSLHRRIQDGVRAGYKHLSDAEKQKVLIIGGHVAQTPRGMAVDIGRSYSDTTAVDAAVALSSFRQQVLKVVFWKDVNGLLTGNPKELAKENKPQHITHVSYAEAFEMASAGSLLLQIDSLVLAERERIQLVVKNIADPGGSGTIFSSTNIVREAPFKTVITQRCDLVRFECPDMVNQAEFADHLTAAFSRHGLIVNDVLTAGASLSITVALPSDKSALELLRHSLEKICHECSSLSVGSEKYDIDVSWSQGAYGNVSLVGDELADNAGILSEITAVLAAYNINIYGVTHEISQRKVSLYVHESARKLAAQVLHGYFIDRDPKVQEQVSARKTDNSTRYS